MSLHANVHSWINEQLNTSALASACDASSPATDVGGSPTANKLVPTLLHSVEADLVSIRERMQRAVCEMQTLFPDALNEMKNVEENAHKLQLQIDSVVRHVSTVDERTESAVSALAKVDAVKLRMEECANTLSEVHNWKSRISSLDALFESRDYTTVASELCDMKQSLSLLQNLPEFENRKRELSSLCDRLETILSPQLIDAMKRRDAELVSSMLRDFEKIGQLKSVERLYQSSTSIWIEMELRNFFHVDTHEPAHIVSLPFWISDCLKDCLLKLRDEHDWISNHVPALGGDALIAHALKQISRRLDDWLQKFVQQQQEMALPGILDVFEVCVKSLSDLPALPSISIVKMMMRPFLSYHRRYAELEGKFLDSQLDDRVSLEPQASGVDETLRSIDEALEAVSTLSEEALSRCCRFAFGSAAKQLMTALDSFHSKFIQRLFAFLRKVRGLAGLEGSASHTDSWAELAPAFRLLRFCRRLREELQNFDNHCTSRLGFTLAPFSLGIQLATQGDENCLAESADAAQCLLHEFLPTEPSEFDFLSSLRQNSDSESKLFLSRSADSCQKLVGAARSFVFDLMFVVIKRSLNGFENFPQWVEGADDAPAKNLASFSLQPSDYITVIGDHLFALVPSLELHINAHLVDAVDNDHDGEIMLWLNKIVTATVDLLLDHIQNVKHLSGKGAKQLHVDIDFLLGIRKALGTDASDLLDKTKEALILTKPEFEQFSFNSDDARAVANKIASIRGFNVHLT